MCGHKLLFSTVPAVYVCFQGAMLHVFAMTSDPALNVQDLKHYTDQQAGRMLSRQLVVHRYT